MGRSRLLRCLALSLPLGGCELVLPYLEEQRTDPSLVYWTGRIYDGPDAQTAGPFTGGTLTLTDRDGAPLLDEGGDPVDDPYEVQGNAGSWVLTVPVDIDVMLRLSGDGYATTVWQGHTPSYRGYWFNGALYARQTADLDAIVTALQDAALLDTAPPDLAEGQRVDLWAEPDDRDAWVGVTTALIDAEGRKDVLVLTVDDDGTVRAAGAEDPVDYLFAFDLAPGDVTLEAATATQHVLVSWPAEGGDLLNASFLALSEAP
jgi:hypothetical protein